MSNPPHWLLDEYNISMASLVRRPLPAAGTAMLLYKDAEYIGKVTVNEPLDVIKLAKGNYRVYHVDIGRKQAPFRFQAPTADGYQLLDVRVDISYYISDPRQLLESRPPDLLDMLLGYVERITREVTQSKQVNVLEHLMQAEQWIAKRITDQVYPAGVTVDHANPRLQIADADRARRQKQRDVDEAHGDIQAGEDRLQARRLAEDPAALEEIIQTLRSDRQTMTDARFQLLKMLIESGRFEDIDLGADGRAILSSFIAETMTGSPANDAPASLPDRRQRLGEGDSGSSGQSIYENLEDNADDDEEDLGF